VLVSLFGIVAAVLAAAGVYGVTSRAVAARARDVGIRIAFGAQGGRLVMTHTLTGVLIGVAIGLPGALVATRALAPYLFGVTATDPVTYGVVFALLASVSVVATWVPARRAARVAPALVLRDE
jgi:ABC-type antimicrobial peptide transport system permease subunit